MPFDTLTFPLIKGCHDMQSIYKVPQPIFQVLDAVPNRPMPVGPIVKEDRRFVDFLHQEERETSHHPIFRCLWPPLVIEIYRLAVLGVIYFFEP